MNRERVQMLRDMMEGIPDERVALRSFYTANGEACNTIACIAGWAAIYPPFVEQGLSAKSPYAGRAKTPSYDDKTGMYAAAIFFEVPYETFLFKLLGEFGSDKEVALARLDALLASE